MPKLKEPNTLEDLAIETLGSFVLRISQIANSAVDSGRKPEINITGLHEFLHAYIPPILSRKITVHMYSVIRRALENLNISERTFDEFGDTNVKNIMKSVILGSICPDTLSLDMSTLPKYAKRTLTENIYKFIKLNTLIVAPGLSTDSIELLPIGLSSLKFLVKFQMRLQCTDAIIDALGSCCSEMIEQIHVTSSKNVTNASFKSLAKCHKLTHLSIFDNSMTAEGYAQFLQSVQQYEKSEDTGKRFLYVSAGSYKWVISSSQLNQIAITCPMLRHLEIAHLDGDMNALGNLTELEELKIGLCDFHACNLDGFLRSRGKNLTSLKLMTIDAINLINIMNHCVNLKELKLFKCIIMETAWGHTNTVAKIFQNLEILDLSYGYSIVWLEPILYTCFNIKRLHLVPDDDEENITDEFILRLLSKNPMQNLTNFSISSNHLSMISLNALIDQCPLLESLEELVFWFGVTDTEIKSLRQKIKDQNQDLRINLFKDKLIRRVP